MRIEISYPLYIKCMAALLEIDVHSRVIGDPTPQWTEARKELKAAMLKEVSREMDDSVPALLRPQI